LIADLRRAGRIANIEWEDQFLDPPQGGNGGGDTWRSDGRLPVITLTPAVRPPATPTP
jgi:hypothetical protein